MRNCCWLFFALLATACAHRPAHPPKPADQAAGTSQDTAILPLALTPTARVSGTESDPAPVAVKTPPHPPSGYRIGVVRAVGTGGRFILFETGDTASLTVASGQELLCFRPVSEDAVGRTALVRVSRERKPPFVVADVVNGQPQAGDEVFEIRGRPVSSPSPTPSATSFLLPPGLFPPASNAPRSSPPTP